MTIVDDVAPRAADRYALATAPFTALGRAALIVDSDFKILHASALVSRFTTEPLVGRPLADLLGNELFSTSGTLRQIVARGDAREGWRAAIRDSDGRTRLISITAAPLPHGDAIILLRPADADPLTAGIGATALFGVVARSHAMTRIFSIIQSLHSSTASVLLTGERGCGKRTLARAIHAVSPRFAGRFIAIDCRALPSELLENEILGKPKGGLALAAEGTLFLDEIGDLPLSIQTKLLHALPTQARLIASASADLHRAIGEARFRTQLYERISAIHLDVPPLRARREDIEPIAQTLAARAAARHGREIRMSPDAMRALLRYTWPGNVAEMENAIEHGAATAKANLIHAEDLPPEVFQSGGATPSADEAEEAVSIRAALESHHWNREATARALGISRTTLWRKMRELHLV